MYKKLIAAGSAILLIGILTYVNAVRINPGQIKVRQQIERSQKIDFDTGGETVLFFSDLHYGSFTDDAFMDSVIGKIENISPDIIIFGGDLIDPDKISLLDQQDREKLLNNLEKIKARHGKYAVLGEDDLAGKEEVTALLQTAGFVLIGDQLQPVYIDEDSYIQLIGFNTDAASKDASFSAADKQAYTIVVSHYPDIYDQIADQQFDLMLAGHSLGGQVYVPFFSYFSRDEGCLKHFRGRKQADGHILHISNGLGKVDVNARLWADADILVYRLDHEAVSFAKETN